MEDGYWVQHQPFLEQSGYNLRSKFRPDYQWPKLSEKERRRHPDTVPHSNPFIMDATRAHDGKPVMLKWLSSQRSPKELEIAIFFSAPERKDDPQNHCVPVWDVLQSPFDQESQIIVMPRLYPIDQPKFDTVGEAIDAIRQTFEGLEYMHRHHVAHKDISILNIMMDARDLYPHGHHPVHAWATPSHTHIAKHLTRTHFWPRYHIIDFDRSKRFDSDSIPASLTIPARPGTIHYYPENRHNRRGFFNPFPADVYALASVLTDPDDLALSCYPPLRFLRPLWDQMLQKNPELRPTMGEALEQLYLLCTPLPSSYHLRLPLYYRYIPQRCRQIAHILSGRRALPYNKFPLVVTRVDSKDREFLTAKPPDTESEVLKVQ
ncbi:hypothetical protein BDZ89DRAFT_1020489 [Hymenopellis radicata]|nr:hypothetical protein BDZ89DRAFT_1020489 [Hymenopellis radicata]